ncbi:MAG: hypothetical protein RCG15_05685 [Candidatus Rickettsia vulgarisii]
MLLDFGVAKNRNIEMTLVDTNDKYIEVGSIVTIKQVSKETFVGYDGKLYMSDSNDSKLLEGRVCKEPNSCCNFNILVDNNKENDLAIIDLGKVICK